MFKLFEKYPAEDLANLQTYFFIGTLMVLMAEIVKVIV